MARKFKIGDKVRIVNVRNITSIPEGQNYIGKETKIVEYGGADCYLLDGVPQVWFDNELEAIESEVGLFEKITKSIVEAAKTAPVIVEQTEDGGIKISPLTEKQNKSGIYVDEDRNGITNVYVVFGGGINVATGDCRGKGNYCIGFQELDEVKECGTEHNEKWNCGKTSVHFIINDKRTIDILRDSLNIIEDKLNKED